MQRTPLLKAILYPVSLIYGVIVFIRNRLFDSGIIPSREFNIPVISIGNITVGGTGKTPVTEYLAGLLMNDFSVAVLSRGYKRKTKGFILADENSTPAEIGDEPCQIKAKFPQIIVAVCKSRVRGVKKLLQLHPETDVILLDDAFQHRYINPGLSILLIDYNNPVSKDILLPSGNLREAASEKKRADIILVTKCPDKLKPIETRIMVKELDLYPFQQLFFSTIRYGNLLPVFPSCTVPEPETLKESKPDIILVSGIANPRPLKKYARGISVKLHSMVYSDHHDYTDRDILEIEKTFRSLNQESTVIITTEKDAVRLRQKENIPESLRKQFFYVPIQISFNNDDSKKFNSLIRHYVRNNKRNGILYKGKNIL